MILNNKQGYQLVEASFMMPLVILVSSSIVFLVMFFFQCVDTQCKMHEHLIEIEKTSVELYKIKETNVVHDRFIEGVSNSIMHKDIQGRVYLINESMIIRMKDIGYEIKK